MIKSRDRDILFLYAGGFDCHRLNLLYCDNTLIYYGHARLPTVLLAGVRHGADMGQGVKESEDASQL